MKKALLQWSLVLLLALSASPAHSAVGPHGGPLSPLASREHRVLPGYSVELVERSSPRSAKKKFEVFLWSPQSNPVDLMHSGYWGVFWIAGKERVQLEDDVRDQKRRNWKSEDSYAPLHSFVAEGKVPPQATEIEVVIALPSKGGTGVATFRFPISSGGS